MKPVLFLAAVATVLGSIACVRAQAPYPSRPIRLLLPFGELTGIKEK
jgi:hypothetical protein